MPSVGCVWNLLPHVAFVLWFLHGSLGPWVPGTLVPGPWALGRPLCLDNDADGRTLIRPPEHHQLVHTSPMMGFVMIWVPNVVHAAVAK